MQNPFKIPICAMIVWTFLFVMSSPAIAAGTHYDLGVFAFEAGDYAAAESYFKKALEKSPGDARICHFLGKTYIRMEQFDKALTFLNAAWKADPNLPGLKFDLGTAYFKQKDDKAAAGIFRSIADEDPDDVSAAYYTGISLYRLGSYSEAPPYLIRAADKSSSVRDVGRFYAGICYAKTGQMDNALRLFKSLKETAGSAELREAAADRVQQIEQKNKSLRPYSLFVKAGVQHDSNVNLAPVDGDKISEESDWLSLVFFSGKIDAYDDGDVVLGAGYSHYQTLHADLSEYDMTGMVGSLYGKYKFHPFTAGLTYYPAYYRLDDNGFLMRHQIRPEFTCEAGDRVLVRATIDHFINNHLEDSGRSGNANAGEVELLYGLSKELGYAFVSAGIEDNRADHPDFDYELIRAKLGASLNLAARINLRISAQAHDKDYDNADSTFLIKRNDSQYKGSLTLSRPLLYDWLTVSGEFELIRNDSNIDAFEYREALTMVSLSALY